MLARKHLVSLIYKPLRHTVSNIHHRALSTQKEKNEQQEKQYNKEQSEQEKRREQKYEWAYKKENYKKDEWDDERKSKKWGKWIVGGSIVVGIYVGNYMYTRHQEDKAPRLAFERGHVPALNIPTTTFIPKDAEISDLSKVIEACADLGQYLVIYGEHGCGKTTLIKQICNSEMIQKHGCVYVSIPRPVEVEDKGVKQVNAAQALVAPFSYIHHGFWPSLGNAFSRTVAIGATSPPASLAETLSLIERGAKEYASRTHQQPILVIDNINHLATAAPLALEALQDQAKEWADTRILMVIFVSSDGAAPPQLKGRSAYSRAAEYFARGIPEPVAVDYLCKKLEKEIAEQVVRKLTGDRLHLILAIAKKIQAAIFQKMESHAEKILNSNIADTASVVINAILDSPSNRISFANFREIVISTIAPGAEVSDVIDALRRSQIFFANEKVVTFQSAGMLEYLKHNRPPPPPSHPATPLQLILKPHLPPQNV